MCGRYTLIKKVEDVERRFNVDAGANYKPRYNAAPTQLLPVITSDSPEGLSWFYWGLIPAWSKEKSISQKLINARSETVDQKASFKTALANRRCLIPADGFYEWKQVTKKGKVPYRITLLKEELFAFAGLWDEYEDEEGDMVHTFTILTTKANTTLQSIHDRMPVILTKETEKIWLNRQADIDTLKNTLKPYDPDFTRFYTVSTKVNSAKYDDESLVKAAPAADQFGNYTLFS